MKRDDALFLHEVLAPLEVHLRDEDVDQSHGLFDLHRFISNIVSTSPEELASRSLRSLWPKD